LISYTIAFVSQLELSLSCLFLCYSLDCQLTQDQPCDCWICDLFSTIHSKCLSQPKHSLS